MKYRITYWTIGSSGSSCALAPVYKAFICKATSVEEAKNKLFGFHSDLSDGNIVSVEKE